MAYIKATDFAVKDSLLSGNANKIIRGTEIDTEYNAIAADSTAKDATIALKADTTTVNSALALKSDITTTVTKDSSTGAADMPSGTTAQRPAAPTGTKFRYNTTLSQWEGYDGASWGSVGGGSAGATGAGTGNAQDHVFNQTDQLVTGSWTVGQDAMVSGVTVTIASPGVFTLTGHGFTLGQPVRLTTTGALPTGLSTNAQYFVIAAGLTADNFQLSTTAGGSGVVTTGTQSGVHSIGKSKDALITKALIVASGQNVTVPSGSSIIAVGVGGGAGATDLYVNTVSNQTIDGVKTFSSPPKFGSASMPTPSGTAPIYGCRAWCVFNGTTAGTNAPTAGGNVTSVTRIGTGNYSVLFTTAMPDANYCIQMTGTGDSATGTTRQGPAYSLTSKTTTGYSFWTGIDTSAVTDWNEVSVAIFR